MMRPPQLLVSTNVFCDPQRGGCNTWTPIQIPVGNYIHRFRCPGCGGLSYIPIRLARQSIYAYGDESSYGNVIAYGLVLIHAHNLPAAQEFLSGLKRRYGVDPQAEFHCKVVFHGSPKSKSPWKNLSEAQVLDFAEELISGLAKLPSAFIVGAVHRSEYPKTLPAVGKFAAGEMGTKQLAGLASTTALFVLKQYFVRDQVRFIADSDPGKIPFFGRKVQAHSNYRLSSKESDQQIVPEPFADKDKRALLQAADLFSYTATHALTEKPARNKARFERWYKTCNPATGFLGVSDESVYALQDPVQEIDGFAPHPSRLEARHAELMAG
jgi:hypothetical protein